MESLQRGLNVLACFTSASPELKLVDICRQTGIAPSTGHRVLAALVDAGFLVKTESNKTYSVGLKAYSVGTVYLSYAHSLIEATRPALDILEDLTQERIALHVLDHHYCVMVASRESPHPVRFTEPIGSRTLPHCSATGKAMLSGLDSARFFALYPEERLTRVTAATITTRTELLRELEQIRETGVALNAGENFSDMRGVAAPIRNATGTVVAAISIAGPSSRIDIATLNLMATLVTMAGHLASNRLGYLSLDGHTYTAENIRLWWADGDTPEQMTELQPV